MTRDSRYLSITTTEDGTVIIVDAEHGDVSGRTLEEAEAEVRRRRRSAAMDKLILLSADEMGDAA